MREADEAQLRQASEIVCGSCGSAMTLEQGQAAARAPRSRTAALGLSEQWFVSDGEGRAGPYSAAQLARMLERGELGWTSQVWREGLKDWRSARRDDLLVFAVASVRGMASDTSRLDTLGDLLLQDDTRVEGERPERFVADAPAVEVVVPDAARTERFTPAAPSSLPAPASVRERDDDPASEDTQPTSLSARLPWLLRHSTPLIAVGAFVAGALITQLAHRLVTSSARVEPARPAAALAPRPPAPAVTPSLATAALTARAPGPLRTRPDDAELKAELARLDGPVHRCVRRVGALDVSLVVVGESGRVDAARIKARGLRAPRLACVVKALAALEVAPFATSELPVTHRYRW